jgi:hypothetical protein
MRRQTNFEEGSVCPRNAKRHTASFCYPINSQLLLNKMEKFISADMLTGMVLDVWTFLIHGTAKRQPSKALMCAVWPVFDVAPLPTALLRINVSNIFLVFSGLGGGGLMNLLLIVGFGIGEGLWPSPSLSSLLDRRLTFIGGRHLDRVRIEERTKPFQRGGLKGVARWGLRSVAGMLRNMPSYSTDQVSRSSVAACQV